MCISFLQLYHRPADQLRKANLGVLLIEFLELYGRKFNYMQTGIRIRDGGRYISKEEMQKDMIDGHRPSLLCIEDPLLSTNDIGRSSYGVLQVKRAFDCAYIALTNAVNPLNIYRDCSRYSILSRIVRVTDEVVRYRRWVEQQFTQLRSPPMGSPSLRYSKVIGTTRSPRSLSSSGSTSSVDSAASSEGSDPPSRGISPNNNMHQIKSQKSHLRHNTWTRKNKNQNNQSNFTQQYTRPKKQIKNNRCHIEIG